MVGPVMAFGIVVLATSLYRLTGWTSEVSETTMVVNAMLQGAGLGFVFIPLQVIAFATLVPALRTEGTARLSLPRNVGSAVGISVTGPMVTRNEQIEHAVRSGSITPLNRPRLFGASLDKRTTGINRDRRSPGYRSPSVKFSLTRTTPI